MLPERSENARQEAAAPESVDRFYLPGLDILRFFAFLSVFGVHVFLHLPRNGPSTHLVAYRLSYAGAFGVDLFFALSAYLITELLLREQVKTGMVDVRSFYVRRILRIWPLYFFFLAVAALLPNILYWSDYRSTFSVRPIYFLSFLFFLGNFAMCRLGEPAFFVAPLWSVSIEEQFYLLWPWAVRKANSRTLAWVATALLVVTALARLVSSLRHVWGGAIWLNTLTRLDPMAIGILLATVPRRKMTNLGLPARVGLMLAGAASWLLVAYYCELTSEHPTLLQTMAGYPVVALGSAAFLVAALGVGSVAKRSVLNRWLVYLGKISYGLYVYHAIAIILGKLICFLISYRVAWDLRLFQVLYVLISFLLTLTLAAASYRLLEAPFLRLKRRFTYVASRPV